MANTALITGASGGIGLEFAKIHAEKGGNVVLVARSKDKLENLASELKQNHKVEVHVIAEDLSQPDAANKVFEQTESLGLQIDTLINNAGFGGHGLFHERDLTAEQAMVQVNITTLMNLSHLYLKGMVERNKGQILNVSSTASFIPGPLQAVYYATKAFVTSFSQALAEELADTQVTITALCPGPVATGFVAAGDLEGVDVFKNAKSPRSVAECGYTAMEKGELVAFNEGGLKFMLNWITPFLPRKTVLKLSRKTMEKTA
ncbi:SDR family NAD(P)-dependent oxidoreductase [Vibrio penaeicida]|uniref:SDR family NAD(P)-dependent oxidoreductase n=1 Tax=Vibrio penaeicida TaxID=104609 RepID=UPI000CEA3487|nr:SDR family oxidoreductase [Vibrio penaeicida]